MGYYFRDAVGYADVFTVANLRGKIPPALQEFLDKGKADEFLLSRLQKLEDLPRKLQKQFAKARAPVSLIDLDNLTALGSRGLLLKKIVVLKKLVAKDGREAHNDEIASLRKEIEKNLGRPISEYAPESWQKPVTSSQEESDVAGLFNSAKSDLQPPKMPRPKQKRFWAADSRS